MELDRKYIGRTVILIQEYDSLNAGACGIIKGVKNTYQIKVLSGTYGHQKDTFVGKHGHTCQGLIPEGNGYNVPSSYMELVDTDYSECIGVATEEIPLPFGYPRKIPYRRDLSEKESITNQDLLLLLI